MAKGQRKRRASTSLAGSPKRGRTAAVQPPDTTCSAATPDPDWFDASDPAKVLAVKVVLRASLGAHDQLPLCREREIAQLQPLLRQRLQSGNGGFSYVAGTPGIGKTLTVRAVVLAEAARLGSGAAGRRDAMPAPALVYINCMSLDGNSLLTRVAEGLQRNMHRTPKQAKDDPLHQPTGKVTFLKSGDAQERLQSLLQPLSPTAGGLGQQTGTGSKQQTCAGLRIVILDELDGLMGTKPTLQELKQLLAIACHKDSRLLVIGIANAFTLAEEYAHELNLVVNHMQKVLFHPYSRQQMASILRQQVDQLPGPVFEPMALSLCAAKMADNHGDVRKALSTCEAALNMLVEEAHSTAAAAGKGSSAWERRLIGPDEISRAAAQLSGGYGNTSETVEAIRALPADQKLALIAAYHLAGSSSSSAADSGSSASAATEVFLREDSNGSISSCAPKAPCAVRAAAAGICTGITSGFRCRKPQARRPAAGSSGQRGSAAGSMRQDCRLGPLHRHYQSLCKQMVHEHVQTLGFGEFQCVVTDLMSRVLTCRSAKHRGDSTITVAVAGEDIMTALADSRVYKHLLSSGR